MGTNEELVNVEGPLLSDGKFFERLREDVADFRVAKALFLDGKRDEAVHTFAEYVRQNLDTDAYFSIPRRERHPKLDDASLRRATNALEHRMSSCGTPMKFDGPVDWYANPTFNQYKEWTWQLSRHPEIFSLAYAYNATRDDKYAEGATELLMSWIRQARAPSDDVHSHMTMCWRTIECGIRLLDCWPYVINSLIHTDAFTDEVIFAVAKSLYEHQHRMAIHYTHHNWLIMELTGMINIASMLPYFKESEIWLAAAIARFESEAQMQVHPEGFQYELSTDYHGVVIHNVRVVVEILDAYKVGDSTGLKAILLKMLDFYSKLLMSSNQIPDLNDGRHGKVDIFIDPYLRYCGELPWVKWVKSEGKEGNPPEFLSNLLPTVGIVCFRESWEKGAVTALFDGGKYGSNHQHEDKLSLVIYKDGRAVLLEGNKYAYDTSKMRAYVLTSPSHNVTLVDGNGQNRRKNYRWNKEDLYTEAPIKVRLDTDIELAEASYGELEGEIFGAEEIKAVHKRRVAFVKKPHSGNPYFIVLDSYSADTPRTFTALWHVDDEELEENNGAYECDALKLFLLGDIKSTSVVKGQEEPFFQGFTARSDKQLDYYAVPTLLVDTVGTEGQTLTLITPDGKSSPISSVARDADTVSVTYTDGYVEIINTAL